MLLIDLGFQFFNSSREFAQARVVIVISEAFSAPVGQLFAVSLIEPCFSHRKRCTPTSAVDGPNRHNLRHIRVGRPVSNAIVLVTTLLRNSRSWLTISSVPENSTSCSSSNSKVSASRSLVGSSRTIRLAGLENSFASKHTVALTAGQKPDQMCETSRE